MVRITLTRPADLADVADRWQSLEARAEPSFFQSWTWVGCLADERFPDPVLLTAEADGRTLALALFNRTRRRFAPPAMHLAESGVEAFDSVFVEHNGPLLVGGQESILPSVLRSAADAPVVGEGGRRPRRLRLSGIGEGPLLAAQAAFADTDYVRLLRMRPAPFVDLAELRRTGAGFLRSLSANTRYQLRRSARCYGRLGPIGIRRPSSLEEAQDFLNALIALHQASWQRRGRAGKFAMPGFLRFHRMLLTRALPRGEVDLLHVTAGEQTIGYLYNFRFRGRVLAYQSGFNYADAERHEKPGMTCHHMAIEAAMADRLDCYDFLAGADRYKTSMANGSAPLYWLEISPRWSPGNVLNRLRDFANAWRGTGR